MLSHHHDIDAVHRVPGPEATPGSQQIFYGRDVFAPIVARLAGGAVPAELGEHRDDMALLDVARPERRSETQVLGEIIYINRFGNLVTNIHETDLANCEVQRVRAGDFTLGPLRNSYDEVPPKMPLSLFGSAGYLEIAYNGDRADQRLEYGPGVLVTVSVEPRVS